MRVTLTILIVLLGLGQPLGAQLRDLEIFAGAGYTLVDVEGLAEADDAIATDWDQAMYQVGAKAFFGEVGSFELGAQAAYRYLYWYNVRIPFTEGFPIRRSYEEAGMAASGILRRRLGGGFYEIHAGLTFIGTAQTTLGAAFGFDLPAGFGLQFQADVVGTNQVPVGVGVSYRIPGGGEGS